jgi:hypothetical protein
MIVTAADVFAPGCATDMLAADQRDWREGSCLVSQDPLPGALMQAELCQTPPFWLVEGLRDDLLAVERFFCTLKLMQPASGDLTRGHLWISSPTCQNPVDL